MERAQPRRGAAVRPRTALRRAQRLVLDDDVTVVRLAHDHFLPAAARASSLALRVRFDDVVEGGQRVLGSPRLLAGQPQPADGVRLARQRAWAPKCRRVQLRGRSRQMGRARAPARAPLEEPGRERPHAPRHEPEPPPAHAEGAGTRQTIWRPCASRTPRHLSRHEHARGNEAARVRARASLRGSRRCRSMAGRGLGCVLLAIACGEATEPGGLAGAAGAPTGGTGGVGGAPGGAGSGQGGRVWPPATAPACTTEQSDGPCRARGAPRGHR
jgi:hypothetical protein